MILKRFFIFVVLSLDISDKLDSPENYPAYSVIHVSEQSRGDGGQTQWTLIFSTRKDSHNYRREKGVSSLFLVGLFSFFVMYTCGMSISSLFCVSLQVSCN